MYRLWLLFRGIFLKSFCQSHVFSTFSDEKFIFSYVGCGLLKSAPFLVQFCVGPLKVVKFDYKQEYEVTLKNKLYIIAVSKIEPYGYGSTNNSPYGSTNNSPRDSTMEFASSDLKSNILPVLILQLSEVLATKNC